MSVYKTDYMYEVIRMIRRLAEEADVVAERHKEFFDKTYNAGGADEITQADIDAAVFDISLTDFTSGISLLEQYSNFVSNSAVTAADWQATMNRIRRAHSG